MNDQTIILDDNNRLYLRSDGYYSVIVNAPKGQTEYWHVIMEWLTEMEDWYRYVLGNGDILVDITAHRPYEWVTLGAHYHPVYPAPTLSDNNLLRMAFLLGRTRITLGLSDERIEDDVLISVNESIFTATSRFKREK